MNVLHTDKIAIVNRQSDVENYEKRKHQQLVNGRFYFGPILRVKQYKAYIHIILLFIYYYFKINIKHNRYTSNIVPYINNIENKVKLNYT